MQDESFAKNWKSFFLKKKVRGKKNLKKFGAKKGAGLANPKRKCSLQSVADQRLKNFDEVLPGNDSFLYTIPRYGIQN